MNPNIEKVTTLNEIRNAIRNYVIEQRKKVIIIIDEAHQLRSQTISDLKMLFNFDMDSNNMVTVILIGHQSIVQMLNSISNEAMRQRITMNYTVGLLDNETCKEYIKKKLGDAGCHLELFTPNALDSIHSYSNGTPRIIDSICSAALQIANAQKVDTINSEVIDAAFNEVSISL